MPSLFAGTENFNPAFEGRRLAIQSGAGAAQALTSGMNSATHRASQELQSEEFAFKKKLVEDANARLPMFKSWLDSQTADDPDEMGDMGSPKAWANSGSGDTLNVSKAQRIIKAFTDDPSWLADPRTSHAANSVFGAAAKVVGMNMTLERLNSQEEVARAKNSITGRIGQSLLKLAETGEVGAGIAAKWLALGEDGNPLYLNPANAEDIFNDYKAHTATANDSGDLVGIEIKMPDGSTVQAIRNTQGKGYTVVPRKGEAEAEISRKESAKKISQLESDARELEKKYIAANAEYVEAMTGQKVEGDTEKAIKNKADYFRARQMDKVRQVESLRTPTASTNSPAASAPAIRRPTKAIAADYVQRLGREKAIEALKQEGYDTSGYAD